MLYRESIASAPARFVFPDGKDCIVRIEISAPFFHEESKQWRCELDLNGLEDEVTAMIGEDSLSALSSALYFLRLRIERSRAASVRVLYPESEEDFQLDFYFPPGLSKERPNQPPQTTPGAPLPPCLS